MHSPDQRSVLPSWRPRVQSAEASLRPTRAEVDLPFLRHNARVLAQTCHPARILAVVKADAYGHGAVRVAQGLQGEQAVYGFGVALAEEALELRAAGIRKPILVLNGVYGGAYGDVLEAGLTPVVYDLSDVAAFAEAARGKPFGVHLKIDTGMARLGVMPEQLDAFLKGFSRFSHGRIDGVMTHLASSGEDVGFTQLQFERFMACVGRVRALGMKPSVLHVSNSGGALCHPPTRMDMVRPGLALYGYAPTGYAMPQGDQALQPAFRLRTEVIALRELPVGATVGYSGTYRTTRVTRVATVPIGYGDGLMRTVSSRGAMLVRGQRCPIIGLVSMDLTMIDVTDLPSCEKGDEVVVLGKQGEGVITAEDVARFAGTSVYEVLTNISRRVPRFYLG